MKEIKAIVQPFKAGDVLFALHRVEGVSGVMASQVSCTSAARGTLNPDVNTRIELVVEDHLVEQVVSVIQESAATGRPGAGRIFVVDVVQAIPIRSAAAQP